MASSQGQSLNRERSFIETNFVETLKQPQVQVQTPPQRVMGSPSVSGSNPSSPAALATQKMAERLEEKAAQAAQSQELFKARDEIIDLKEKLETLKLKRAKDQDKIKEFEKIRIQYKQLVEFKSKIKLCCKKSYKKLNMKPKKPLKQKKLMLKKCQN